MLNFTFESQNFPFTRPLPTRRGSLSANKCYHRGAKVSGGITYKAEVGGLAGIHARGPQEVRRELEAVLANGHNNGQPRWDRPGFGLVEEAETCSVQALFALESLLLAMHRDHFLRDFQLDENFSVPLNGFIPGPQATPRARELAENGFTSLKIKLGVQNEEEELAQLRRIAALPVSLRLDANGRLNPQRLKRLLAGLEPEARERIEYIEEPYQALAEGLREFSDFPLALDESLLENAGAPKNCAALVVKPGRHLALSGTIRLIKRAPKVVVSSAYESPLGIWSLAHLAAVSGTACGLDVQKYFAPHPNLRFHPVERGRLHIRGDYHR